jgi:hypothetical protein
MGMPIRSARLRQGDMIAALAGAFEFDLPAEPPVFRLDPLLPATIARVSPGFPEFFVLATVGL